jgi:SNF2 family DNA or RNA helicase
VLEVGLAEAASRKRPAVIGIIEDHLGSAQKVVVFTGRRRDCEALGKSIRNAKGVKASNAEVWVAHGGDSHKVRDEIIRDYMAHPGPCVLVGTGPAFGESLNIHDTDAALFVMLPYTPGQLRQWEGRFCRLGQARPCIIYYIVAEGTVDEHMAAILIDKLPAVVKVVEDTELGEAAQPLAGIDPNETDEEFAESVLGCLDW